MLANDRNRRLILAAIVVCGFILRVWGLTFGLPLKSNLYIRPDESLLVAAAARFWDTGGHPGFFAYPALMTELCALLYLPWKLFGDGIPSAFSRDPGPFFLIARGLSVAASTASILLVHAIAKRLISATGALMAAAFFAFSPLAVRDAHFGVTDSLLVCLLLASLAWPFRNVQWPDIAALGAIFGLACSTKYTAILLAPAIGLRIIMRSLHAPKQAMRNVAIAGACCALVFVLLNPYIFLQQGDSSGQVYELFSMFYRTQPGDTTWSARHAVQQVLRPLQYGPGGPVGFALAGVGAVLLLSTRKSALPVVVAAAVCVAALLPFKHNVPYRYTLPLLPLISILAAASLEYPKRALWKNLLASLVIAFTAWNSARLVNILTRPDTRTLAGTWIEKNVPADTPILLLGPPEAEPQIHESPASIQRRIDYVHRLYGPNSGSIVSQPYLMMKAAGRSGREVFRGVPPEQIPGQTLLVVAPASPLPLVGHVQFPTLGGTTLQSASFVALNGAGPWTFDEIDAFFLPFHPLDGVVRPGPTLNLALLRR